MSFDDTLAAIVRNEVRSALDEKLGEADWHGNGPLLVSVGRAAELLDVSRHSIRQLIESGELEHVDGIGRGTKVVVSSLEAYIERAKQPEVAF